MPTGFQDMPGPLRGIVLRVEEPSSNNALGQYHGKSDVSKPFLVNIKVRIPEIHPFPEPDVYGPEGDAGIISLYPTFVAINCDLPTPAVGDIVYVDYGDRKNLEDPKYFGTLFNQPIFGGTNILPGGVAKASSFFDSPINSLKDFLTHSNSDSPIAQSSNISGIVTDDNILNNVRNFWQNDDKWGPELIGYSTNTIGRVGCLLTTLTIATNALNKHSYTPKDANIIVREANGFKDDSLLTAMAAESLGLKTMAVVKGTLASMKDAVDLSLQNGGFAILHVEFDPRNGNQGDHFVLIHSRIDGYYNASDPAYGATIKISSDLDGDVASTKSHVKLYKPNSVTPIFKL